jgi:hypothetical protein
VLIDPCSRLARERRAWPGCWRLNINYNAQIRSDETLHRAESDGREPDCQRNIRCFHHSAAAAARCRPRRPALTSASSTTRCRSSHEAEKSRPKRSSGPLLGSRMTAAINRYAGRGCGSHLTQPSAHLLSSEATRHGDDAKSERHRGTAAAARALAASAIASRPFAVVPPRLDPSSHVSSLLRSSLFAAVARTRLR